MKRHPDEATLHLLMAGRLDADRAETLLAHVVGCESCLQRAEEEWGGIEDLAAGPDVPRLSRQGSARIESRLLHRIHLAELGTQVTWLATGGFLSVTLTLLRPIVRSPLPGSGGDNR